MTLQSLSKAPFPWFGGKRKASPLVWRLLGDVDHYVEPFAGTMAVLLNRPHPCNRPHHSETVNDADGLLVNAWRAIQWSPEATAEAASWPVSEADKQARQIACLKWRTDVRLDRLVGDAQFHDPTIAGWWLYGVCCQIGAFTGDGAWSSDPVTGRIVKQAHQTNREPGVSRDRPHLSSDGQGVHRPAARKPGVSDPGGEYHPVTMPELVRWFRWLSARLRHVRITNGDWSRVVKPGVVITLTIRRYDGHAGIFLDPPYHNSDRATGLYTHDDGNVVAAVHDWCAQNGNNPRHRIVVAGYDTEHGTLTEHGWTAHEWFTDGWLNGGMGQQKDGGHQQKRERLWASPHCLPIGSLPQGSLWEATT